MLKVLVAAAATAVSAVTPDAACNFIGMRYAGVQSVCTDDPDEGDICYLLDVLPDSGLIVYEAAILDLKGLHCSRAVELVSGILSSVPAPTLSITEVLEII